MNLEESLLESPKDDNRNVFKRLQDAAKYLGSGKLNYLNKEPTNHNGEHQYLSSLLSPMISTMLSGKTSNSLVRTEFSFTDEFEFVNGMPAFVVTADNAEENKESYLRTPELVCYAFSGSGRHLTAGDDQGTVRVWDANRFKLIAERNLASGQPISCVRFFQASDNIIVACDLLGAIECFSLEDDFNLVCHNDARKTLHERCFIRNSDLAEEVAMDSNITASQIWPPRISADGTMIFQAVIAREDPASVVCDATMFITKITRHSSMPYQLFSKNRSLVSSYSITEDGSGLIVSFASPLPHERAALGRNIRDQYVEVWPHISFEAETVPSVGLPSRMARWAKDEEWIIGWKSGIQQSIEARVDLWDRSLLKPSNKDPEPIATYFMERDDTIFHVELLTPFRGRHEQDIILAVCFTEFNESFLVVNVWDAKLNSVITRYNTNTLYKTTLVGRRQYLSQPEVMDYHWGHNEWVLEQSLLKMCVSPDRRWIAFYSSECNCGYLWSIRAGVPVARLDLPPHLSDEDLSVVKSLKTISFDPNGTRIVLHGAKRILVLLPAYMQQHRGLQMRLIDTPIDKSVMLDTLKLSHSGKTLALSGKIKDNNVTTISTKFGPGILNAMEDTIQQGPSGHVFNETTRVAKDLALSKDGSIVGFIFTDNFVALSLATSAMWDPELNISHFPDERQLLPLSNSIEHIFNRIFFTCLHDGTEQVVCFSLQQRGCIIWFDLSSYECIDKLPLSVDRCLGVRLSKNRTHAVVLSTYLAQIIDLEKREVVQRIGYAVSIPYARHILFTKSADDAQIFFRDSDQYEVSEDGNMVLIGWDNDRVRPLYLTPETRSRQFRNYSEQTTGRLNTNVKLATNSRWVFVSEERLQDSDKTKGICVHDTLGKIPPRRIPDKLDKTGCRPLFAVSEDGRIIAARSVFKRAENETILSDTIMIYTPYAIEGSIPDFQRLQLTRQTEDPDTIHKLIQEFGWSLLNAPDSENKSLFQHCLTAGKREWMIELSKLSKETGIPINLYWKERDEIGVSTYKNSLQWALQWASETQSDEAVWFQLKCLRDQLTTVSATAAIAKSGITELYTYFPDLFMHLLEENLLVADYGEASVALKIFRESPDSFLVGSDSNALSWGVQSSKKVTTLWKSMGVKLGAEVRHGRKRAEIRAESKFVLIEDIAQVGMRGLLRRLLLLGVPVKVFETDVVRWTIAHKWNAYGFKLSRRSLLEYILLLVSFTTYAVCIGGAGDSINNGIGHGILIAIPLLISIVLALFNLKSEHVQVNRLQRDAQDEFQNSTIGLLYYARSQWNWIELCSYIMLLFPIPLFHFLAVVNGSCERALTASTAIESILLWWKILYFAQALEVSGPLVVMIREIVMDIRVFLLLAWMILIGFSTAFFVLFRHDEESDSYKNVFYALSTMYFAILGDFDFSEYRDAKYLRWLATALFVFYTMAMLVILLNLVIAIMSDSYDKVKSEETANFLKCRAMVIDDMEASMSDAEIKATEAKISRYLHVLQPVSRSTVESQWHGKIGALEKTVQQRLDESDKMLSEKLQALESAIKSLQEYQPAQSGQST